MLLLDGPGDSSTFPLGNKYWVRASFGLGEVVDVKSGGRKFVEGFVQIPTLLINKLVVPCSQGLVGLEEFLGIGSPKAGEFRNFATIRFEDPCVEPFPAGQVAVVVENEAVAA